MPPLEDITAFILAGGASSRMGMDKTRLDWHGRPLAQFMTQALTPLFSRVAVISKSPLEGVVECIVEAAPARHPALGWITALENARTTWAFIIAVDMPLASERVIRAMAALRTDDASKPIVPRLRDGRWQPLHALVPQQALPAVRQWSRDQPDGAMQALCETLEAVPYGPERWTPLDAEGLCFSGFNTPEEYRRMLEAISPKA